MRMSSGIGFVAFGLLNLFMLVFAAAGDRQMAMIYLGIVFGVVSVIGMQEYECQHTNRPCTPSRKRKPRTITLPPTTEGRKRGDHK